MSPVATFLPVDNIMPYLLIAAVFEALAVYLFQFRKTPGAMPLVCCQVCKSVWVAAKVFVGLSPELPAKLFWARFTEWAPLLLIYFWFEFIWEVSRPRGRFATPARYAIRGITAVLALLIGCDSWLGWYYGPLSLEGQVLTIAFGPAAWATIAFCYGLNIICLGLSAGWIYRTRGLRRQQAIVLSLTPMFNFVGNILSYAASFQMVLPQVTGQLLSAVYVTWVFYRWRVYSILPLARDAVTGDMIDGLMVIDEKGYIVDINPAAKTILAGVPATVGDEFKEAAAAWPALAEIDAGGGPEMLEAVRNFAAERRFYQLRTMPLRTPQGNPLGKTIIFKDITRQKQNEKRILETEKALAIMNERDRLGKELHDGPGQIWNYLSLELQNVRAMQMHGRLKEAEKQLARLIGVVKELNADARESIVGLKRTAAAGDGFIGSLQSYLAWYEKNNGIATRLVLPAEPAESLFSRGSEVQLLRIVLEALTNIRKHAKAGQVKVVIEKTGRQAVILIEDDGCGFDITAVQADKKSFGLQIMAERAAEAGGRLEIESAPGAGTRVRVYFSPDETESRGAQGEDIIG